jgi:nucleoside-diphosphate kinase
MERGSGKASPDMERTTTVTQRTLIILKPDCVQRRLIGRILQRFEDKGMTLAAMKLMQIPTALAERLYAPHKGKPFYQGLLGYITSGPVVVMVVAGPRCIDVCRKLMGKTFGFEAEPGSIRGDFGASTTYNLVHGSDSEESAAGEIPLFFNPDEFLSYDTATQPWSYKPGEAAGNSE